MAKKTKPLNFLQEARERAARVDAKLRSNKRLNKRFLGSVLAIHEDGSILLFDSAFALVWKPTPNKSGYVAILTEHHGVHVYDMEDLKHLRALGPRARVGSL